MLKQLGLGVSLILATACGGEPLNPDDFELSGNWGGFLTQGNFGLGILRLTFNPERCSYPTSFAASTEGGRNTTRDRGPSSWSFPSSQRR
jgi:hypothetical protein